MNILLHTCCTPCSVMCIETLRAEGHEPTGYWSNPNIHPLLEYRHRQNAMIDYARTIGMELVIQGEYGLRRFITGIYPDFDHRCAACYRMRLEETARYAAEHGYDAFTTTLLISPYQKHDIIRRTAEQMENAYKIPFMYSDFRPFFREGQQKARDMGLYMQKYCGCIFSEEERYAEKHKTPRP